MAQVTQSIRRLRETGKPVLSALILGRGPTTVMVKSEQTFCLQTQQIFYLILFLELGT